MALQEHLIHTADKRQPQPHLTLTAIVITLLAHGILIPVFLHLWSDRSILPPARILEVDLATPPPPPKSQPVIIPPPPPIVTPPIRQTTPPVQRAIERPVVQTAEPLPALPVPQPVAEPVKHVEAPPPPVVVAEPRKEPVAAPPAPVSAIEPPSFNAAYLNNPRPDYPANARRLNIQGTVVLRVMVSPEGLPEDVQVLTSSGSPILDKAGLQAVRGWKFVPARQGDKTVRGTVNVPVRFSLDSP
ncbi:MAG: energy transducer TonB [Gammaproteobacteria bacterium]|nr:energy transducer TonB [Gammaproteobacteria bacterium]